MATRTVVGTYHGATIVEYRDDDGALLWIGYEDQQMVPEQLNEATLRDRARNAIAGNNTYLALPQPPTNAENLAQLRRLTRECSALIRLTLGALDTTDGT